MTHCYSVGHEEDDERTAFLQLCSLLQKKGADGSLLYLYENCQVCFFFNLLIIGTGMDIYANKYSFYILAPKDSPSIYSNLLTNPGFQSLAKSLAHRRQEVHSYFSSHQTASQCDTPENTLVQCISTSSLSSYSCGIPDMFISTFLKCADTCQCISRSICKRNRDIKILAFLWTRNA